MPGRQIRPGVTKQPVDRQNARKKTMKKIALLAITAAAAIATPAMAQSVTGTITLTGTVGPKCFVDPGAGSTFTDSVNFGALDAADGTLRTNLASQFATKSFTVKCTSGNPGLSITAAPLATAGAAAAGYDNSIDFDATLTVDKATGGTTAVTDASGTAGATTGSVGSPLANSVGNVRVTTANYATGTATDLLVAGTYNGLITVVISPN
jgi:hypothetical protein